MPLNPPTPASVEAMARAIHPGVWAWIDSARAAAKCYRETPFEQAGFQSQEAANERADDRDAAAQHEAERSFVRARAAILAYQAQGEGGDRGVYIEGYFADRVKAGDRPLAQPATAGQDGDVSEINRKHRYLIRNQYGSYVSSTDDLGVSLPIGYGLVDTIGVDGLGTLKGHKGIDDFLRCKRQGVQP